MNFTIRIKTDSLITYLDILEDLSHPDIKDKIKVTRKVK